MMPYVYDDPIMFGQNPFARPANQRPVPVQSNGMTRPMPVRPGSGQAINTQSGQVVIPQSVQSNLQQNFFGDDPFKPTGPSIDVQDYVQQEGTTDLPLFKEGFDAKPGQTVGQVVGADRAEAALSKPISLTMDETAPEAGGSILGTGGFELIGLMAMAALFYYISRA